MTESYAPAGLQVEEQPRFPCIEPLTHRYTSGLCPTCPVEQCWAGPKPVTPLGYRRCGQCGTAFRIRGRNLYCSNDCRLEAIYTRRKQRRAERDQILDGRSL